MATNSTASSTVRLEGASSSDALIGRPEAKSHTVQVMHLEMSAQVLEELLSCTRKGKIPQVYFGRNPVLRYDGQTHVLEAAQTKFRQELYCSSSDDDDDDDDNDEQDWSFKGLVNHKLTLQRAEEASAAMDQALAALKSNMASIEQDREARKTVINTPEVRPSKPSHLKLKQRSTFLKPGFSASSGNSSLSPGLTAIRSPSLLSAHELVVQPDYATAAQSAMRHSIVHLLAIEPLAVDDIAVKIRAKKSMVLPLLKKLGRLLDDSASRYSLVDKFYKELDVWSFPYEGDGRDNAVDNAIRAYDRLRLPRDETLWQMLLPKQERGKGKVLSRLRLHEPAPKASTPGLKPKIIDRRTGLPKRSEAKRNGEKDAASKSREEKPKDSSAANNTSTHLHKESRASARTEKESIHASDGEMAKPKSGRAEKYSSSSSRAEKHSSSSSRASKHPPASEGQTGEAGKGLTNKPKNPSPLSASPPVNASDFEDDHPVHKALSGSPSPSKSTPEKPLKRKAQDVGNDGRSKPVSKKQRLDHSRGTSKQPSSSSSSTSTSLKRKMGTEAEHGKHSTATKHRRIVNGDSVDYVQRGDRRSPQSSDSSSSLPLALSWRQNLDLANKFRKYYERYAKLYMELSSAPEPPSQIRRDELMKMHRTLESMKKEIRHGALR